MKRILPLILGVVAQILSAQITYTRGSLTVGTPTVRYDSALTVYDRKGLVWRNPSNNCQLTIDMRTDKPQIYSSTGRIDFYDRYTATPVIVRCGRIYQEAYSDTSRYIYPPISEIPNFSSLRAVSFEWKQSNGMAGKANAAQYGLIAQEVEQVFPELVLTDENGEKHVDYNSLIPLLIFQIKETMSRLEKQNAEVEDLKKLLKMYENEN
ncbi:MAG: tail fiber domain-containing protein [Muribaculum sp.]|nr:tail fiber domain-containing protein [Muribaculum sp.]